MAYYDPGLDVHAPGTETMGKATGTGRTYSQLNFGYSVTDTLLKPIGKRDSNRW